MSILEASNNGGRYNTVHNQTDDGSVISVLIDGDYVPLVFSWKDWANTCVHGLLSSGRYHHKRLMRSDCGVRRKDDSEVLSFSWKSTCKVIEGFSSGPDNELHPITRQVANCADDVLIDGMRFDRTKVWRKDREYWEPGEIALADTTDDIFSLHQRNPLSCPPDPKDKCGNYILKGGSKC